MREIRRHPERRCAACRARAPKSELLRFVRGPGEKGRYRDISFDRWGVLQGRGAYTCARRDCVEKAFKTGSIWRSMQVRVPEAEKVVLKEHAVEYLLRLQSVQEIR